MQFFNSALRIISNFNIPRTRALTIYFFADCFRVRHFLEYDNRFTLLLTLQNTSNFNITFWKFSGILWKWQKVQHLWTISNFHKILHNLHGFDSNTKPNHTKQYLSVNYKWKLLSIYFIYRLVNFLTFWLMC